MFFSILNDFRIIYAPYIFLFFILIFAHKIIISNLINLRLFFCNYGVGILIEREYSLVRLVLFLIIPLILVYRLVSDSIHLQYYLSSESWILMKKLCTISKIQDFTTLMLEIAGCHFSNYWLKSNDYLLNECHSFNSGWDWMSSYRNF